MKYEYKVFYFNNVTLAIGLNEHGAQGWKLIQYHLLAGTPQEGTQYHCIFVRELKPTILNENAAHRYGRI